MAFTFKFNPFSKTFDIVQDTTLLTLKGVVNTTADLPLSGNSENDLYIVKADDRLYTWNKVTDSGILSDWINVGSISSIDWSIINNKPTSAVEDIDDAVTKKHTQNIDTILTIDGSIALFNAGILKRNLLVDNTFNIQIDEIRARDGDGLKLNDDGGNGIFVKDGGNVGIGTPSPSEKLEVAVTSDHSVVHINAESGSSNEARLIMTSGAKNTTFFYRESDNNFGFFHNGLTKFRVVSNGNILLNQAGGNVSIGTTTTSDATLNIKGSLNSTNVIIGLSTDTNPALKLSGNHSSDFAYIQAGGNTSNANLRIAKFATNTGELIDFQVYSVTTSFSGNLGVGNLNPNAKFDVTSTTDGSLPAPRLTTSQRDAITSPPTALQVFNTDNNRYEYFDGTDWQGIDSTASAEVSVSDNTLATDIPAVDALVLIASTPIFTGVELQRITIDNGGVSTYIGFEEIIVKIDGNITLEPSTSTKDLETTFFRQDAVRKTVDSFSVAPNSLIFDIGTTLSDGDTISFFGTEGTLPAELRSDIVYFVINQLTDSFQVSYTSGGSPVTFTDSGSGTNTFAEGELHGSVPRVSVSASSSVTVVPQALATVNTGDSIFPVVSNKSDAVNIVVSKVYYRIFK